MATAHGRVVRALRVARGDAAPSTDDLDRAYYAAMADEHRASAATERAGARAHVADARRWEARGNPASAGAAWGRAWNARERATQYDGYAASYDRMAAGGPS